MSMTTTLAAVPRARLTVDAVQALDTLPARRSFLCTRSAPSRRSPEPRPMAQLLLRSMALAAASPRGPHPTAEIHRQEAGSAARLPRRKMHPSAMRPSVDHLTTVTTTTAADQAMETLAHKTAHPAAVKAVVAAVEEAAAVPQAAEEMQPRHPSTRGA